MSGLPVGYAYIGGQSQPVPAPAVGMKGVIQGGPMFSSVDVELAPGEKAVADGGSLVYKDASVGMETECFNGCWASCMRNLAGESCCMNVYTGPGKVGLSFDYPGDMMCFAASPGNGWILSDGAFVCGTTNLQVSGKFQCCSCVAGENLFLTKVTCPAGQGMFFAGGFGAITRHDVPPGQTLLVDNGLFFAAHESTQLRITLLGKSAAAMCCSGEGFVMKFHGPCCVFTQNRDPMLLSRKNNNEADKRDAALGPANFSA